MYLAYISLVSIKFGWCHTYWVNILCTQLFEKKPMLIYHLMYIYIFFCMSNTIIMPTI